MTMQESVDVEELSRRVRTPWLRVVELKKECDARRRAEDKKPYRILDIADKIGRSESTVSRWLRDMDYLPSRKEFLGIADILGGQLDEYDQLWRDGDAAQTELRRMTAQKAGTTPEESDGKATELATNAMLAATETAAPTPLRLRRRILGAVLAAAVAAAIAIVTAALTLGDSDSPSSTPSSSASTWPGTIGNTYSEAAEEPVGAYSYADPDTTERSGPGYPEGTQVVVVCYRHGREWTDPTLQTTSTTWYQLTAGNWISDIYFVPDPATERPVSAIPMCE